MTFSIGAALGGPPSELAEETTKAMMLARDRKELSLPSPFLSGLDCLTSSVFTDLFGGDVLSTEESLSISRVALLFTDIKGSTALYSRVGDAMMAAFARPAMAMQAAIAVYRAFQEIDFGAEERCRIKMGVHAGQAIVVTLNDRLDY